MLRIGTIAGSFIVGLAFLVFGQETLPKKEDVGTNPGPAPRSEAARKALAERIEIPEEFRKTGQPVSLRSIVAYIDDKLSARGRSLPIVVDHLSIKEANHGEPFSVYEAPIELPPSLRNATVQELIEQALKQVPNSCATYLIRNGRVDILAHHAASIPLLLDSSVAIQFRQVPLKFAIEDLADQMGFTVMIDPQCGDALATPISLHTQNDISARGILLAWGDMFDLTLAVNDHRVVLMPRARYLKKLQSQAEEVQLLRKMDKNVFIEVPTEAFPPRRLIKERPVIN
jgi:hypothetical protein